MIKGQKVSSMHACMQFDVYLSDPHYTEKVAICCGEQEISGFRGVVRLRGMRSM